MPKIKDLGINIVPGTMRPPEIGDGGGGGGQDSDPSICDCNPTAQTQCGSNCDCVSGGDWEECKGKSVGCSPKSDWDGSNCDCVSGDPQKTDGCGFAQQGQGLGQTNVTPYTPQLPLGALTRADITRLRSQLRQALINLNLVEDALQPKTIAEVEAMEQRLREQLELLQERRAELEKDK
jgi:hypothetical protein